MTDETYPVLYILMRNDLSSLNAGKAMAQSSHASNAFVFAQLKEMLKSPWKSVKSFVDVFIRGKGETTFIKWVHSTSQGFGTVLVLAVNETQMRTAVKVAQLCQFTADVINDPTYPYRVDKELVPLIDPALHTAPLVPGRDGMTACFRSEDTCAYIFGDKNDPMLEAVVGRFPLHP